MPWVAGVCSLQIQTVLVLKHVCAAKMVVPTAPWEGNVTRMFLCKSRDELFGDFNCLSDGGPTLWEM